ncbi:MAG: sulfatase-like hydrolase/transferase [Candidatus Hydrogenedentes bacterium]|nr:sulfatase-like hydrolase/transferase [Candidatus Hydrogenedentota bacterium]
MNRRTFLQSTALAGLTAAGFGAKADAGTSRPNILWIMMDDCRPDALSCYGQPWARTPNMDRIAERGVRFEAAVTQCPICIPSRSSMKTSHYCHEFGLMSMGDPPVNPPYTYRKEAHFPDLLRSWTGVGMQPTCMGKVHAFRPDWDVEDRPRFRTSDRRSEGGQYPPVNLTTHGWQIGGTVEAHAGDTRTALIGDGALEKLDAFAAAGKPFFLRVSFHAPHVPIEVPPEFMIDPESVKLPLPSQEELDSKPRFEREQLRVYSGTLDLTPEAIQIARGTYYGMVWQVDHEVGRILAKLDELGLRENTIIAICSDHGLQLGEHGVHKKRSFYEQTILTPLVIAAPGKLKPGTVVSDQVEMIDFIPTLMDLSGLEIPGDIRGRSLVPLMNGGDGGRAVTFSEIDQSGSMYDELRKDSGRQVMARTRDWKLIEFRDPRVLDPDGALHDLKNDPGETRNLFHDPAHQDTVAHLRRLLAAWEADTGYGAAPAPEGA